MHFLECYALNCGLKIDKPFIEIEECEIPTGNYITFHGTHPFQSKSYSNWQNVIDSVLSELPNLTIVQIGNEPDAKVYSNVENYLHKTNFNQSAYLVKKSLLHFGIDSFPAHLASCFDVPSVILYSHTYKEQCYPFFTSLDKMRLIQAPLNTARPSYNSKEEAPCIDNIRPLEVSQNIIDLLNEVSDSI